MSFTFLKPTQDSRHIFCTLLREALESQEFRARISLLLDRDPYFIPAYVEHIWLAEMRGDTEAIHNMMDRVQHIVWRIISNSDVQTYVNETWTGLEMDALYELFDIFERYKHSISRTLLTRIERYVAKKILLPKTHVQPTEYHLKLIKNIDVAPLQDELRSVSFYWWNVATTRAEVIHYHKHTHVIMLRHRPSKNSDYVAVDGVHESIPTFYADRFPVLHGAALSLAKELNLALGRVAIVRLPPFKQTYRHYDAEPHYVGRKRYHWVLGVAGDNILSSGDETVRARVGDLWYFDNHVMHRTHNKSPMPRVHMIFDGYPLTQ